MNTKSSGDKAGQPDYSEIIKKAYEKGVNEQDITLQEMIENIKYELKSIMII
ncbi:hypothetical protein [Neobacillus terrae]|uniref:hypothetical protein n=1 Tax=Neobacillus terrae TaxID=3034837 RepID=UPI0014084783|nr:hypothetical protein [Neobacillus terrae]NHM30038.1 hypothetical protein [Neobacillus terrae]